MPDVTGDQLCRRALEILNVFQPGAIIPSPQMNSAFYWLNAMLGLWALQEDTIPSIVREVWPLTANKGGPENLYTYGPGGDFNTTKAPLQTSFTGAALMLDSTVTTESTVIIPRALLTDDQWQALQLPGMTNNQFTQVWYNPSFSSNLGQIGLWPVPNTTENSLILFRKVQMPRFQSLATIATIPEGYDFVIPHQLAKVLATPFGRELPEGAKEQAEQAFRILKRGNVKLSDLAVDAMFTNTRRGGYNINTGTGG